MAVANLNLSFDVTEKDTLLLRWKKYIKSLYVLLLV